MSPTCASGSHGWRGPRSWEGACSYGHFGAVIVLYRYRGGGVDDLDSHGDLEYAARLLGRSPEGQWETAGVSAGSGCPD